jgi:hypothetical protein
LPLPLLFSCHPSPQAVDLLLFLQFFVLTPPLHQIVILSEGSRSIIARAAVEGPAVAFVVAFANPGEPMD